MTLAWAEAPSRQRAAKEKKVERTKLHFFNAFTLHNVSSFFADPLGNVRNAYPVLVDVSTKPKRVVAVNG